MNLQAVFRLIPLWQKYEKDKDKLLPALSLLAGPIVQINDTGPLALRAIADVWEDAQSDLAALLGGEEMPPINSVRWIQAKLNILMNARIPVDNRMGSATSTLTFEFQKSHPPLFADGLPGTATALTILSELRRLKLPIN